MRFYRFIEIVPATHCRGINFTGENFAGCLD
jgi:hypothetical protein